MSEKKPAVSFAELPEGWPELVREIIVRNGHAIRPCASMPMIEVKSLTTNTWHPLGLPGGGVTFISFDERNILLSKIEGK